MLMMLMLWQELWKEAYLSRWQDLGLVLMMLMLWQELWKEADLSRWQGLGLVLILMLWEHRGEEPTLPGGDVGVVGGVNWTV